MEDNNKEDANQSVEFIEIGTDKQFQPERKIVLEVNIMTFGVQ